MLIGVDPKFVEDPYLKSTVGQATPVLMLTIWISLMNRVYRYVAVGFNDLENYRTDSEYADALIFKTVCFQFLNSYIAAFYVAFAKSSNAPMGAVFDLRDAEGDFHRVREEGGKRGGEGMRERASAASEPEDTAAPPLLFGFAPSHPPCREANDADRNPVPFALLPHCPIV